ncbi:MAG: 50S ribosomal protein L23 [Deltaproteobacteria bacterium]|nr:50S ribosomal protein L23 [Deltaproteobacteria bacterium]MBW2076662.1 50S ribosomal protein L23 [Deltaproteobacteria bacterium]MBW2310115.1 50S ribosomal protein L23 [Deltaproteobacteria bacterium]
MDEYQVLKRPLITEKGTRQKEQSNQMLFEVDPRANKVMVRNAVESIFRVKVRSVRLMNVKGKERRIGRNVGRRPDWKKAIVRLGPGENIEFFEGI